MDYNRQHKFTEVFPLLTRHLAECAGCRVEILEGLLLAAVGATCGNLLTAKTGDKCVTTPFSVAVRHPAEEPISRTFEIFVESLGAARKGNFGRAEEYFKRLQQGGKEKAIAEWDMDKARDPELLREVCEFLKPLESPVLDPEAIRAAFKDKANASAFYRTREDQDAGEALSLAGPLKCAACARFLKTQWIRRSFAASTEPSLSLLMSLSHEGMEFFLKRSGFYGPFRIPPMLLVDSKNELRVENPEPAKRLITRYLDHIRKKVAKGLHYTLKDEERMLAAKKVLAQSVPASLPGHLSWSEGLYLRFVCLMALVRGHSPAEPIGGEIVEQACRTVDALLRAT